MRLRWSKWTATMGIVAVFFLASGVWFLFDSHHRNLEFEAWQTARPMKCAVDFSKPGKFDADFIQTCSSSHGEVVALRIFPDALKSTNVTQLLAGLEAIIEIKPTSGTNKVETASAEILWQNETLDGAVPVFSVSPFRKGSYKAHVVVTAGAPALVGTTQILEARYLLCGLEALPAFIARAIGISFFSLGFLIGAGSVFFAVKRGTRRS